jgi:hypothetical protein
MAAKHVQALCAFGGMISSPSTVFRISSILSIFRCALPEQRHKPVGARRHGKPERSHLRSVWHLVYGKHLGDIKSTARDRKHQA